MSRFSNRINVKSILQTTIWQKLRALHENIFCYFVMEENGIKNIDFIFTLYVTHRKNNRSNFLNQILVSLMPNNDFFTKQDS